MRSLLVRQHTQEANSLRGMLSEFRLTARSGRKGLEGLVERVETGSISLPQAALEALAVLVEQWRSLAGAIETLSQSFTRRAKSAASR